MVNYTMHPIANIIIKLIDFIQFLVILYVIIDLLIQFRIISSQNSFVMRVYNALGGYIEPILDKIRKILPIRGGIDFSPLVLLFLISSISYTIGYYAVRI